MLTDVYGNPAVVAANLSFKFSFAEMIEHILQIILQHLKKSLNVLTNLSWIFQEKTKDRG